MRWSREEKEERSARDKGVSPPGLLIRGQKRQLEVRRCCVELGPDKREGQAALDNYKQQSTQTYLVPCEKGVGRVQPACLDKGKVRACLQGLHCLLEEVPAAIEAGCCC